MQYWKKLKQFGTAWRAEGWLAYRSVVWMNLKDWWKGAADGIDMAFLKPADLSLMEHLSSWEAERLLYYLVYSCLFSLKLPWVIPLRINSKIPTLVIWSSDKYSYLGLKPRRRAYSLWRKNTPKFSNLPQILIRFFAYVIWNIF